jgi:hypothetical protein
VPTSVARPLIHGLKNPVVVTDDAIRDHVDVELTPFDDAVAKALGTGPAADQSAPTTPRGPEAGSG